MDWNKYWETATKPWIEKVIQGIKYNWGYKRLLRDFYFPTVKTSLEMGAGKAYLSRILKERGVETTCVDNELDIVLENQEKVDTYYFGDAFRIKLPIKDLTLSCGFIEHFKINKLRRLKIVSKYILMFYPSCDWRWRLFWKLRMFFGAKLHETHYKHSNELLEKVFDNYTLVFGSISFFGLYYDYFVGIKK